MDDFLKKCSACGKEFTDLIEYKKHIKKKHKDVGDYILKFKKKNIIDDAYSSINTPEEEWWYEPG